jgi:hypothetical protein
VGAGSLELSTNGLSSVDEFELSSSSADSFDDAYVDDVSLRTSSPGSSAQPFWEFWCARQ